ncbi:MAG: hypothetical protein HY855_10740, partial [Burkholderiales bacterium]|nr:hypothetical protein [Burkholderiales bacterium]
VPEAVVPPGGSAKPAPPALRDAGGSAEVARQDALAPGVATAPVVAIAPASRSARAAAAAVLAAPPPAAPQALSRAEQAAPQASAAYAPADAAPGLAKAMPGPVGPASLAALRSGEARAALSRVDRAALDALALAARGRWQVLPGDTAAPAGPPLREWPVSGGSARLDIDSAGARWTEPDGRQWLAPLEAATRARLRGLF